MKGSIRQRGKNSWQIRVFRMENGEKQYDSYTVHGTKEDAQRELRKKLTEMDEGRYVKPCTKSFSDVTREWLGSRLDLRQTTLESYESVLNKHVLPTLGNMPIGKIRSSDLASLYASKRQALGPRRLRYIHVVTKSVLSFARSQGYVATNVADSIKGPKVPQRDTSYLTGDQMASLLRAVAGTWLEPAVYLALTTGMRRGEILALRWQDVDLNQGIIRVSRSTVPIKGGTVTSQPKSDRGFRSITISEKVVEWLREHRQAQERQAAECPGPCQDNDLVCALADGSPFSPNSVSHSFATLVRSLDIPHVRFHDLRHSHASFLLANGVHPKVLQERLGHSSYDITMNIYGHVAPTIQRDAANKVDSVLDSAEPSQSDGQNRLKKEGPNLHLRLRR